MDKHRITDEIAETMREVFETTEENMVSKVNQTLVENQDQPSTWGIKQRRKIKTLSIELSKDAELSATIMKNAIDRSAKLADYNPNKVKKDIDRQNTILIAQAIRSHADQVKKVDRLKNTIPLSKAIFKQTQEGIEKGVPVAYRNGRTVGYKEYMEMNVRTTVQQEISQRQLEVGGRNNIVFYIANEFADCADDHAEYQGRIYYDERFMSFDLNDDIKAQIKRKIDTDGLLSIQSVRNGKPYLTTRPNCRHTLTPIAIDRAMGTADANIVQELGLRTGSYKPQNYKQLQEQRYNERQIRHFKSRMDQNKTLNDKAPSEEFNKQITHDRRMVRQWQKRQRDLLEQNPDLERDYRRETKKVLLQDLGAKYQT